MKSSVRFLLLLALPVFNLAASARAAEGVDPVTDDLRSFLKYTFIQPRDAMNYSDDLQKITGLYFCFDPSGDVEIIDRATDTSKQPVRLLKDDVVYNAVVSNQFGAGVTLPFLNFGLEATEKAEVTIQNVARVTLDFDKALIKKKIPEDAPKDRDIYWISAATLTTVSRTTYSERKEGAGGILKILQIGGKKFYSTKYTKKDYVVSISHLKVRHAPAKWMAVKWANPASLMGAVFKFPKLPK